MPCRCRTSYCLSCWDRALAASVASCGAARCPSCRSSMSVDFDASTRQMSFAVVPAEQQQQEGSDGQWPSSPPAWRDRLYKKAMPLQIELLQQYGRRRPSEEASRKTRNEFDGCTDAPGCVCGCRLKYTSVRERVLQFVAEVSTVPTTEDVLDRLMATPPLVCDICERLIKKSEQVWTCENGPKTVLHAGSFDICEECFEQHAYCRSKPAAAVSVARTGHNRSQPCDSKSHLREA